MGEEPKMGGQQVNTYAAQSKEMTDLEQVKVVAKCLLYTEIRATPYAPMVVQHPFASSGFMLIPGDEFPMDITKSSENLNRWREYMSKKIDSAVTASCIGIMLNKSYGLTFLKFAKPYLSKADLSELLADAWTRAENPNMDVNVTKAELVKMFKESDREVLMTLEERIRLSELADKLTIYRGITRKDAAKVIADYYGTTSYASGTYYDVYEATDRQGRKWKAMSDGSIDTEGNGGAYSCEIVTPVCRWEDIEDIQEIVKAKKFDYIICKSIDKFSRDAKFAFSIIAELYKGGIEILFESENYIPTAELLRRARIMAMTLNEQDNGIAVYHPKFSDDEEPDENDLAYIENIEI